MEDVLVSRSDGLCRITLNRPERLNALNEGIRASLHAAFSDLGEDLGTRIVLIEGSGSSFSAGADLDPHLRRMEASPTASSWSRRRHEGGRWQRLLDMIESVPQVTVARLQGHVIGGGALIAAACDIRIAADDVRIRIPEVALGIPLTWGGIPRLAREVGLPMARYMVMTGNVLSGEEALRCGFVQRLVPIATIHSATDELVRDLLAMPGAPLAMARSAFVALGRALPGSCGWADPEIVNWMATEPEVTEHVTRYVARELQASKRPDTDGFKPV